MGKDNKKIVLSVFLLIFAACERNEKAEKNGKAGRIERAGKNEKAGRIVNAGRIVKAVRSVKAGTAEKNEETGRSLLFQHNLR